MWYRAAWDVLHSVRGESGGEWHRRHVFEVESQGKAIPGIAVFLLVEGETDRSISAVSISTFPCCQWLTAHHCSQYHLLQNFPTCSFFLVKKHHWYRIWNEVKLKHQSVNLRISDHSLLNARCTDFFIAHQLCRCKGLNLLWSIW